MKAIERDGLWRALEQLAADLETAKARGAAEAAATGDDHPERVAIFEGAWTATACKEGAARIRAVCDVYLKPKRAKRAA